MSIARLMQMARAGVPAGWDLANAEFNGGSYGYLNVSTQETNASGVFFKPDGTKMYVSGTANDSVNEYNLSSAWDISSASYVQSFSVQLQETALTGLFFKSDGTAMYIVGSTGDDVNEYSLSSAWDVSTASYVQNFSVATEDTLPGDIFFKSDGTVMYIVGSANDAVYEYSLSSAWDISSASYVQNFSVAGQEVGPQGLFFKDDGTAMYVIGVAGDDVNEYSLSTAWDISTASYVQNFSVGLQEGNPTGIFFKPDGTKMYITGATIGSVYGYSLSSAWDVSTATWDAPAQNYFLVATQELTPQALFFKSDGTAMYVIGASGDDVNQYSLSSAWDISTASYVQVFSVASEEANPRGLSFKSDGTKMYVIGATGDDVNEYSLSSAWDVSTASYVQNFSIATEETVPGGLFFKPDGTAMYVVGSGNDTVYEYSLSSAWDISTTSYVQGFSVYAQEGAPSGLFFKPDGKKMFVIGSAGDDVNEYTLSTAWDISTASYVQNFSVKPRDLGPTDIFFTPDGAKMYMVGTNSDAVWAYDL